MNKAREEHIKEMSRLQDAIKKSSSWKLKKDYGKALARMRRELQEYDRSRRSNE